MPRLMSKVSFPKQYIALLTNNLKNGIDSLKTPGPFIFRIPKSMTKLELKEHLTKIYGLDVKKINTLIQIGKFRTVFKPVKTPDFKKAYVTLNVPGINDGS